MASNVNTISFGPMAAMPDLQSQQLQLQRAQQMADMLRRESVTPIEAQTVTGAGPARVVPISPLQGLAKLGQAYFANKMQDANDQKQIDLGAEMKKRYVDELKKLAPAGTFDDVAPQASAGQLGSGMMGDVAPPSGAPTIPQQTPVNPKQKQIWNSAMAAYLNGNSELGNSLIKEAYSWQKPSETSQLLEEAGFSQNSPTAQAAYRQKLTPPIVAHGSPVLIPGQDGKLAIDPASVEAITQAERAKGAFGNPISLKTSNGQEIQLSPTEWAGYQKTGSLPLRFLPPEARQAMQTEANNTGVPADVNLKTPQGMVSGQVTPQSAPSGIGQIGVSQAPINKQFDESLGTNMAKTITEGQSKAEELRDGVRAIDKSLDLIKQGAILGSGADLKTDAAKLLNSTFGMNISPDKVANTDFLRSTLGMPLLAKAKALGYNPTDADAKRLDTILGTISKDPNALPDLLQFNRELSIKAIESHNRKASGVKGPYSLTVEVPGAYTYSGPSIAQPAPVAQPATGAPAKDVYDEFGLKRRK